MTRLFAETPQRPRVLVLLATYNGQPWIGPQLDSLLGQSGVDLRIVVRDDGSADETRGEIELRMADGRISCVPASTRTGSAGQNFFELIALNDAAEADFVAFCDQDDLWDHDKLLRACTALTDNRFAGYSSAVAAMWSDGRRRVLRQCPRKTGGDFLFEGAGQGCTFVLRTSFYQRVRAFLLEHRPLCRTLHYHDWAIYALARTWDLDWCFDPHPTLRYRQHQGNDTGARKSLQGVARRIALISNGWYARQIAAVAALCSAARPGAGVALQWSELASARASVTRRLRIALFCLQKGRRRAADRAILVAAALAGRI
ncbi:MAG TPA: glycosyltransferase [Steroidobacteraceae bacterium]|jgi:rhamnosyltransferase